MIHDNNIHCIQHYVKIFTYFFKSLLQLGNMQIYAYHWELKTVSNLFCIDLIRKSETICLWAMLFLWLSIHHLLGYICSITYIVSFIKYQAPMHNMIALYRSLWFSFSHESMGYFCSSSHQLSLCFIIYTNMKWGKCPLIFFLLLLPGNHHENY